MKKKFRGELLLWAASELSVREGLQCVRGFHSLTLLRCVDEEYKRVNLSEEALRGRALSERRDSASGLSSCLPAWRPVSSARGAPTGALTAKPRGLPGLVS